VAGIVAALVLNVTSALAQITLPTPDNIFTNPADTAWTTAANWSNGVPDNTEDALIDDGLTAFYDADISGGGIEFGTLTIGVGSTFDYDSLGGGGQDFTNGATIYFENNSQLTISSGSLNSAIDYKIPSGSTATLRLTAGAHNRPRGTVEGAGNFEIELQGWIQQRWEAANFTGNMTFSSVSGNQYLREFGGWSGSNQMLGTGTNTIENNVRIEQNTSHKVPDTATVKLVGAAGGNDEKWNVGVDRSEAIADLIIESPVAASSAPYIYSRNGYLKASSSVSFEGTAGTVEIDSAFVPPSGYSSEFDVRGADVIFGGTGDWTVNGDIEFWFDSSTTISNTTNATIGTEYFRGSGDLTKTGSGTLIMGDGLWADYGDTFTVSAGALSFTNSSSTPIFGELSVTNTGTIALDYTGTGSVRRLYLDGSPAAVGVWGAPSSGAPNTTNLLTGTGFIQNNGGAVPNIYWWDGGDTDNPATGDLVSQGGNGTWNTTTSNWDNGDIPHTTWGNTADDEAIFGGANVDYTVNIAEPIALGDLTIEMTGDEDEYTFNGAALNFGAGATIRVSDNRSDQTFTCPITGSPDVETKDWGAGNQYQGIKFAPTSGTVTLGDVLNPNNSGSTDKAGFTMGGSTTGNSVNSIDYAASDRYGTVYCEGGEWTVGYIRTGTVRLSGGTLIANGNVSAGYQNFVFTGGTLAGTGVVDEAISAPAAGTIAPGDPTGTLTITNNNCDIDGTLAITISGAQVSTLAVDPANTLDITGATLDVTGATGQGEFVIATYGDASKLLGEPFASTNGLPDDASVEYDYNSDTAIAIVIPPPAGTLIMLR